MGRPDSANDHIGRFQRFQQFFRLKGAGKKSCANIILQPAELVYRIIEKLYRSAQPEGRTRTKRKESDKLIIRRRRTRGARR